jgi:hypothetical protein
LNTECEYSYTDLDINTSSNLRASCTITEQVHLIKIMHTRLVRRDPRALRLLAHRPPLPSKQSKHNSQNDGNRDSPVDIIVRLPTEFEAGEAVDDATQYNGRARKEMDLSVYGRSFCFAEAEVVIEADTPLDEEQGQENEPENLVA